MKNYILRKTEKRFKKLQKFYSQFEVNIPSLEYMLYKKYPNNRWITFIIINSLNIGFFVFWLLSLYYVSSVSVQCHNQLNIINQYFNDSNLNFSKELIDVIK